MTCERIEGVLFDKDGTLFDFQATWSRWVTQILHDFTRGDSVLAADLSAQFGFDLESGRFRQGSAFVAGTPDVAVGILARQFPEKSPLDIARSLAESSDAAEQVPSVRLPPLLAALRRRGLRLGLVTNDHESSAEAHLRAAGCRHHFDFLAGSDSGYGAKPDPGMLLAFCSGLGISPTRCVMVGDSPTDMLTGQRAGMGTVAVLTGVDDADSLSPLADAVLENIGELPDWLDTQRGQRDGDGC